MVDEQFLKALEVVLKHEGGYVNDPNDLGGETNYGISKRSYPDVDIKNLTREQAVEVYHRDWWAKYGYGDIADLDVATKVFDLAVNMGPVPAHRLLQQALNFLGNNGLAEDGIIGPLTMRAVNTAHSDRLVQMLRHLAAKRYYDLVKARPANRSFLLGWLNRAYF